jgi:hypothetical protein
MSTTPENHRPHEGRFPQRVLIADIAHPDLEEVELELLPDEDGGEGLPTALYVLASITAE